MCHVDSSRRGMVRLVRAKISITEFQKIERHLQPSQRAASLVPGGVKACGAPRAPPALVTHEQLDFTVNRNHSSQSDRDPIDRWAHIYTFVDIFRYDIGVLTRGTNVHHDCDKIRRNGESIGPRQPYQARKHSTQPIGKVSVITRARCAAAGAGWRRAGGGAPRLAAAALGRLGDRGLRLRPAIC